MHHTFNSIHLFDQQYQHNLYRIHNYGERRMDRTKTGSTSLFGQCSHYIDLRQGFPLSALKKVFFKAIKVEGVWFLSGDTNVRFLKEHNVRIWDEWVKPETAVYRPATLKERLAMLTKGQSQSFEEFRADLDQCIELTAQEVEAAMARQLNNWGIPENYLISGELGPVYGDQWRNWENTTIIPSKEWYENGHKYLERDFFEEGYVANGMVISRKIDQIMALEKQLNDERRFLRGELDSHSAGRRMILSGWNVAKLDEMALPPCHTLAQWSVSPNTDPSGRYYLDCILYQRSADMVLGVPFNVAQYAMFTEMLAAVHGFRARHLTHHMGDAHVYDNLRDEAELLLDRKVQHASPNMHIALRGNEQSITDITIDQIHVENYASWPAIDTRGKVAV